MPQKTDTITAIAPASVANVSVGFDIFGFSVPILYDAITATKISEKGNVEISSISGTTTNLPFDAEKNTAGFAAHKLLDELDVDFGVTLKIEKGIPLGSGLGGSAASAVAAVTAINGLLEKPLDKGRLLKYALMGESIASGSVHGDNVSASLFGGLICFRNNNPESQYGGKVLQIPFPNIFCVLLHPDIVIETKIARSIIKPQISLKDHVMQNMFLSSFLVGCYTNDLGLIAESLHDIIIEPQRAHLIPKFGELKAKTMESGAIAFGISGAGPSMFAFCKSEKTIAKITNNIEIIKSELPYNLDIYSSQIDTRGSYIP